MNPTKSRKRKWPRVVSVGRVKVTVYRRQMPNGSPGFLVADYSTGKRKLISYPSEELALEAAEILANRLSKHETLAAQLTEQQAIEYVSATQTLQPMGIELPAVVAVVKECVDLLGSLPTLAIAARFYRDHHKRTTPKPVPDAVAELLKIKESRGASIRYMQDLRHRLGRFASDCTRNCADISTSDVQAWLDRQGLGSQDYTNFRRVLNLLFGFAVARGYAGDNPVVGAERVKTKAGEIEIFTPAEIARLLAAAPDDFRPCIALGAFAGLRSAEIERLRWDDIDLTARHIVIGASRAKTASRRIVPIHDNLAAWLAPYAGHKGKVWPGLHDGFYDAQQETAAATAVEADPDKGVKAQKAVAWKANGLRHSYASYRFAQLGDAGRVAGELGNSAAVVHRHYRELVKPADAEAWFNVRPDAPANIVPLTTAESTPIDGQAAAK